MPIISEPKSLKPSKTQFIVTFTAEETAKAEEQTVQKLGQSVSIPGFRPGKAPIEQIREKLKPDQIFQEMVRSVLPAHIRTMIEANDLHPIVAPVIDVTSMSPLTLTVTFIGKPEVTLKGFDKIEIEKSEPKVDEKDVQRMIDYLLEQHKKSEAVERAAAHGDEITMDFVGVDEGKKEIEGTRSSGYTVKIGSKSLIPGFEEQLIGLKAGEEKSFQITFPEKYHAEHLRGKPATFTVKVTQVSAVTLPELTDDFAKEHLQADSAADLKKKIEQSMRDQEEMLDRRKREEKLLTAITDAVQVDLAQELIDQELRSILVDLEEQLKNRGQTLEQWMKQTERKPEDLQKDLMNQATRRLKLRFGMEKALEQKEIAVTDDEVTALATQMSMQDIPTPGSDAFEELKWRRRVEKLIDAMLA